MKKIILIFAIVFLNFSSNLLKSEGLFDDEAVTEPNPTYCFKYKFNVGDTLIYHLFSYDSIAIDYGMPVLKTRNEIIEIVCDSIKKGVFYLTHQLAAYRSKESAVDTSNVERTSSPWLGRKTWLAIDSLGNRISWGNSDTTNSAITPGGAFQPYLIIGLGQSCQEVDKTWSFKSLDFLAENAYPLPVERQSSLFRVLEQVDTLGFNCNRLSFIRTAQGSFHFKNETDNYMITNVINGYGIMDFSIEKNIPVHLLATIEQKMQVTIGEKEPVPGWHYIYSYFTLMEVKQNSLQNSKKNKKNKKK